MQLKIIENGQEVDLENLSEEFIQDVGEKNPFLGFILSMASINKLVEENKEELVEELYDFSDALDLLKEGNKLKRQVWSTPDMFIYYVAPGKYGITTQVEDFKQTAFYGPHLAINIPQGYVLPWIPSQIDLLAEDWVLINDNN